MSRFAAGHGAWSQPTTAPASVQVHYHYLAGRYRDLSYERGLGIISSGGLPASSSSATLSGIPEMERDDNDSHSGRHSASNGSIHSASNSLRAIARKSGVKDDKEQPSQQHHHYHTQSSRRLEDLFLGGLTKKDRRSAGMKASLAEIKATGMHGKTAAAAAATAAAPHGAKHGSLRVYAEERIRAQELIEARIDRATDIGRLKWEARAAFLNSSFALAVLLYTRAAQLGSVSASLSLSHLYCNGVTRGNKPLVILIHRDPLRALSWALEAAKLLQSRANAKAKRAGGHSMTSTAAATSSASADQNQPAQIVALLARLLRCRQSGLTAADDEVRLPRVRKTKLGKEKSDKVDGPLLWNAVCDNMGWLDFQLPALLAVNVRDDGESIGPDDDEADAQTIKRLESRTQIALIEALVATKRWAMDCKDEKARFSQLDACWTNFASKLRDGPSAKSPPQGDLESVCRAGNELVETNSRDALRSFQDALEASLNEAAVPVVSTPTLARIAKLESPTKRKAGRQLRRRASLEELVPMDSEAQRLRDKAMRPALLKFHSSAEAQSSATVTGLTVSAKTFPRQSRSTSMYGNIQRPDLNSHGDVARSGPHRPRQRYAEGPDRSTLQRIRRPSSIMSDSPSLLFTRQQDEEDAEERTKQIDANAAAAVPPEEDGKLTAASSVSSSLWEAAPIQASGSRAARRRVTSLFSEPSIAPSESITTEGSTTFDYDIDACLRRQQARRHRGDSNASISTLASMLSTNPSISESMADGEYARGHFLTPSSSSNINGFDLRLGGAADTLRKIRKASGAETLSRNGPAAPQLSDTLEQLIANSASYRAAGAKGPSLPNRSRKNSNASMRSLSAFTANNQRQGPQGEFRPPSLFKGGFGRSMSVLAVPTNLTDRGGTRLHNPAILTASAQHLSATSPPLSSGSGRQLDARGTVSSSREHGTMGALGSLRLLGGSGSSRKAIPASMKLASQSTQAASQSKKWPLGSSGEQHTFPTSPSKKTEEVEKESRKETKVKRAFESFDPTHSGNSTPRDKHHSPSPSITNSSIRSGAHTPNTVQDNYQKGVNGRGEASGAAGNALDPALAEAEDRSGLKTTSKCTNCGCKVVNAPISKSGDVFCSRDCRVETKKRRSAAAAAQTMTAADKGKARALEVEGVAAS